MLHKGGPEEVNSEVKPNLNQSQFHGAALLVPFKKMEYSRK